MALFHSPNIVTSGLEFYYDMSNTQKSWKGAPTTNYIPFPEASYNGSSFVNFGYNYANLGATYTYRAEVSNPVNAPGVLQYFTGTTGYKYFSIDSTSLPVTGTYTFSYYARILSADNNVGNGQLWRANGSDRGVTGDWNPTFTSEWRRYSTTGPAEAGTILQYFPIHSGSITGGYTIEYCGFQLEVGSSATPFVIGARSSTQALLDLTNRYTLTPTNVIYNSNGTFSFNNSWFDLNSNNIITGNNPFTVEAWYTTTGTSADEIFGNYGSGSTSATLWISGRYGTFINGSVYFPDAPIGAGTYFLSTTRDTSGNVILYRNGVQVSSGVLAASIPVTYNFRIGADVNGGAEPFTGSIHSVRVYNRVLTATEIAQNFNAHRGRYGL